MPGCEPARDAMMTHSGGRHGRDTATALAIGIPSKLARSDARREVCRDHCCGSRKDAFVRARWRRLDLPNESVGHIENGILQAQLPKIVDHRISLRCCQNLWIRGTSLGREDAEPHPGNFRLIAPKAEELVEVAGTARDLRGDRAVNRYSRPFDIPEYAVVCGW